MSCDYNFFIEGNHLSSNVGGVQWRALDRNTFLSCDYNECMFESNEEKIVGGAFLKCDYNQIGGLFSSEMIVGGAFLKCDYNRLALSLEPKAIVGGADF